MINLYIARHVSKQCKMFGNAVFTVRTDGRQFVITARESSPTGVVPWSDVVTAPSIIPMFTQSPIATWCQEGESLIRVVYIWTEAASSLGKVVDRVYPKGEGED